MIPTIPASRHSGETRGRVFICLICLLCVSASAQVPVEKGNLRAGASRVVITPAPDAALPMSGYSGRKAGFKSIHDDLHVRAIVVEDGTNQAALIACEVIGISSDLWQRRGTGWFGRRRFPATTSSSRRYIRTRRRHRTYPNG